MNSLVSLTERGKLINYASDPTYYPTTKLKPIQVQMSQLVVKSGEIARKETTINSKA